MTNENYIEFAQLLREFSLKEAYRDEDLHSKIADFFQTLDKDFNRKIFMEITNKETIKMICKKCQLIYYIEKERK